MCRFLLAKTKNKINPESLLNKFANMTEKSKAPDGDWQGDGWGVAWLDGKEHWQVLSSLSPIWENRGRFKDVAQTKILVAHARSASFPQHKGVLAFNQPYIEGQYAFVFNGLLRGVSMPTIPGKVGAEKIWYLVRQELNKRQPQEALEAVKKLLVKNAREIVALNMGLASSDEIYSVSYFTQFPEYYTLHSWQEENLSIVCSERLA